MALTSPGDPSHPTADDRTPASGSDRGSTTRGRRTGLVAAVRSESAKLSWRSPAVLVAIPLAIAVPLIINAAIAQATAQQQGGRPGGMDTSNAAYWVIVFTTFIMMAGAVYSMANEFANGTVDLAFARQRRRWLLPVAKGVTFGLISAMTGAATIALLLGTFPRLFSFVWGEVDLFSSTGVQLLFGIPIYLLLVTLLGIGLAALFPRPGLVLMFVLLWKFGVETVAGYVSGDLGIFLQRISPFRNAELGLGQISTFNSLFGGELGSLAYFGAICLLAFGCGTWKLIATDPGR